MDIIKDSLNPENEEVIKKIKSAGEGMGKSGSFFFFTNDKKFLIKSMKDDDVQAFKKSFKEYTEHIFKQKDSLLARIYGVYSIEMEGTEEVHVLLMKNTSQCDDDYIKYVFDLKGSKQNRKEDMKSDKYKPSDCLKDLNIKELKNMTEFLKFQG